MSDLARALGLVAVLLCAGECQRPPPPAKAESQPARPIVELSAEGLQNAEVRTAKLLPQSFGPRLTAAAVIAADPHDLARLGARVSGRVVAIHVKLGDTVTQGQPLIELDAIELHQVSTEYLIAVTRAKEADDARARQQQLVSERVGALAELRRAEANAEAAHATLSEAEEHLHFLGLSDDAIRSLRNGSSHGKERSLLRSPLSGRVAALTVSLGQVLSGTEDIVTVTGSSAVHAMLRLYERDLANVAEGMPVQLQVPSHPDRAFPGTIAAIGALVDAATRTVEARVALQNENGLLKPGMTATAVIAGRSRTSQLCLPAEAVQADGAERYVFVPIGDRRFEARPVVVGPEQGGVVPIVSGLASGSEVVVHGAFALRGQLERAALEE